MLVLVYSKLFCYTSVQGLNVCASFQHEICNSMFEKMSLIQIFSGCFQQMRLAYTSFTTNSNYTCIGFQYLSQFVQLNMTARYVIYLCVRWLNQWCCFIQNIDIAGIFRVTWEQFNAFHGIIPVSYEKSRVITMITFQLATAYLYNFSFSKIWMVILPKLNRRLSSIIMLPQKLICTSTLKRMN